MPTTGDLGLLREALDRFIALSECGLRACESRDPHALAGALDARELITRRLGDLAGQVNSGDAAYEAWGKVSARTREAARINRELAERAVLLRDDVRQQIDRVNRDAAALGAYAGATPRVAQLDLRR